jgi:signal transduction histidine kinase
LNEHEQDFHDRQHDVSLALSLSPLVAQESDGSLQLHFATATPRTIVTKAIEDVKTELRLDRTPRKYEFFVAASVDRLEPLACDGAYVRHALKNIIRNAVNYSLPREAGNPMIIDVFGERQAGWTAVKVRNWGLGIPEDKRELIFEPWVRGDIADRYKAIRGMGLGLYLARRIISAHDGSVLFDSKPTLNDPARLEALEGFETIFEIRIPLGLEKGTYTHRWSSTGRSRPPRVKDTERA